MFESHKETLMGLFAHEVSPTNARGGVLWFPPPTPKRGALNKTLLRASWHVPHLPNSGEEKEEEKKNTKESEIRSLKGSHPSLGLASF